MNIVVCIKQVPDVPNIRMDKERMTIIRDGVESIINPNDCVALDAALDLRGREGGGITVISMGPPQSEEALREALAYGADRAILLTDPVFAGADTLATSHVLARAIGMLDPIPDLILCGTQTIDSDTGHVGPQVAEELNLPMVSNVIEIHLEDGYLTVKRVHDGFLDTIRIKRPALLTISREMHKPRHLSLADLESAFSNQGILRMGHRELGLSPDEVGFSGSATWVQKLHRPPPKRKGEVLTGTPQFLVEEIIRRLEFLSIIDEEGDNE